MNLLHIITGLNDGGAEGALFRVCTHDVANTHVVVSLMGEGKYGPLLKSAGVCVYCLNFEQGRVSILGLFRLWRLVLKCKPDVVQTWLYHADLVGGLVARMAGCSKVFWGIRHANLAPGTVRRSTILVAQICARLSSFVPQKILSNSIEAMHAHVDLGYDKKKFLVIPNGYDFGDLYPSTKLRETLRESLGVEDGVRLIGMVARFDIQKDHENLVSALAEVRRRGVDFRCILVGTGMDASNSKLMEMLERAGLVGSVDLLGRRTDICAVMNAIDLHVLSSLGEAFPNVVAEAMACGTPCVTTDVGDASVIVGETGWVVPPQDSFALSNAIIEAIEAQNDLMSWKERQLAVRAHVQKNFKIETVVDMYCKAWAGQ